MRSDEGRLREGAYFIDNEILKKSEKLLGVVETRVGALIFRMVEEKNGAYSMMGKGIKRIGRSVMELNDDRFLALGFLTYNDYVNNRLKYLGNIKKVLDAHRFYLEKVKFFEEEF